MTHPRGIDPGVAAAAPGPAAPGTREWQSEQAQDAWRLGCEARAAGDGAGARRWFGRACRLAPDDPTAKLSLAACLLDAHEAAAAASLFDEVARETDAPAAWLGAAAAHARLRHIDQAADCLHYVLSRHALARDVRDGGLLDAIAYAAGRPGWCGLNEGGRLVARARAKLFIRADSGLSVPLGAALPPSVQRIDVLADGAPLLGSPIAIADIRRVEGVVEAAEAGLVGWAWHPGDVARLPVLTLRAEGFCRTIVADDASMPAPRPLVQARRFVVAAQDLPPERPGQPISVLGSDGKHLLGSPLTSREALGAGIRVGRPRPARQVAAAPRRPLAVVVPVYRGTDETTACLQDVLATVPEGTLLIVVDDASPEAELVAALQALAATGRIRLLRHAANAGFPGAANTGLRAAAALRPMRDIVLLNADTRPAPGWITRLRDAVQASGDIGTATPFSNDASIASYPHRRGGPPPSDPDRIRLARLLARVAGAAAVEAPTGVGFCWYLRHECLSESGLLREDAFAQGYGEENDLCLRARRLGWRHVIVPGAYVAHVGGRSFGTARAALLERNMQVLERLHPGYHALVAAWGAADPLVPVRRRLDLARWAALLRGRAGKPGAPQPGAVLLVSHDSGGGVERSVRARAAGLAAAGHLVAMLRPMVEPTGETAAGGRRYRPGVLQLTLAGDPEAFPNLVFRTVDRPLLLSALRAVRPAWLEVHHLLGHDHAVLGLAEALGIPYEMRLHDYASFCARINLVAAGDRYCGEPPLAGCVACIAAHGSRLLEDIAPAALLDRSARDFAGARRIVVPSRDMAARMRRHFAGFAADIVSHEIDPVAAAPLAPRPDGALRIVVVGAIGPAKGLDILLHCARDAAQRRLGIIFVVVGYTSDDAALFACGNVEITGPYIEGDTQALLVEQCGSFGFVPSPWPETWCFALGELFRAGLPTVAFDLGTQAERIRATGRGHLVPLGAPPNMINNIFLSIHRLANDPKVMHTT